MRPIDYIHVNTAKYSGKDKNPPVSHDEILDRFLTQSARYFGIPAEQLTFLKQHNQNSLNHGGAQS